MYTDHSPQCWSGVFFFKFYQKCLFAIIVVHAHFILISQGSVETHLRCGVMYNNNIIANCPQNESVKEFWKSVINWRRYGQVLPRFCSPPCMLYLLVLVLLVVLVIVWFRVDAGAPLLHHARWSPTGRPPLTLRVGQRTFAAVLSSRPGHLHVQGGPFFGPLCIVWRRPTPNDADWW